MGDVEKLCKLGTTLGLAGEPLREWVEARIEENKIQRQEELDKARLEREKITAQQELVEKEIELVQLRRDAPPSDPQGTPEARPPSEVEPPSRSVGIKQPRLPCFDEKVDKVDSYLQRFERHAEVSGWPKENWSIALAALLRGKALEVYTRLSADEAGDYDALKEALLKRFHMTMEGFKDLFRKARPEQGETFGQFRTRLVGYLAKWRSMADKKETYKDLEDLFLTEQLLNTCGKELCVFLKERKPTTSVKLVELAEQYVEAHGHVGAFVKADTRRPEQPKQSTHLPAQPFCTRCKRPGHTKENCRVRLIQALICYHCQKPGHTRSECPSKRRGEPPAPKPDKKETVASIGVSSEDIVMPTAAGLLDGKRVTVLRDSGSSCVAVKEGLSSPAARNTTPVEVSMADGQVTTAYTTNVNLECPYFTGQVEAVEMKSPLYDVILGNVPGAKCPCSVTPERQTAAVETRSSVNKPFKKLLVPGTDELDISVEQLKELQAADGSLEKCRAAASSHTVNPDSSGKGRTHYGVHKGVLYRYFRSPKDNDNLVKQVVVPQCLRNKVLKLAHESIMAGHLAAKKTADRILQAFYWPRLFEDVTHFCRSCDKCQRSTPKGSVRPVPLSKMPLIDTPFNRVAVDLIGPIVPASDRGNRYILTVVDYCTRYPEAIALKNIDTEQVAEALVEIFCRTGVPMEMLSDRGTQFTSQLMQEVCRLLSVRQLMTTPYHPQCNGLVEKFNGTLKSMLRRLAHDRPKDWDRYIHPALFAYREAPQASLGFSPFELLTGRSVRGPMKILRELWTEEIQDVDVKTTYQYVVDLQGRLDKVLEVAQENLKLSAQVGKKYFDRHAKTRKFKVAEKVLLLRPTKRNKLELKWQGPFDITKVKGDNNYEVLVRGNPKIYHANLLKAYHQRGDETPRKAKVAVLTCAAASLVQEHEDEETEGQGNRLQTAIETPSLTQKEGICDVHINGDLTAEQQKELRGVLSSFPDVLTDVPGRTTLMSYDIKLSTQEPVRKKPYPIPQALREEMAKDVQAMLDADIIEASDSAYCSPPVIVKKKDGTNRLCLDFRSINNCSVFDCEPLPRLDELFQKIGPDCMYFSKIDLSKGYWQVPLNEKSKPITAFSTELGLMQFKVLPFGLQGAPAAFSRLMRKVLRGLPRVQNYIDDIVIHTATWAEHIESVTDVFRRLRESGLTAKPSKCTMGNKHVEFLGHMVGGGKMSPVTDKVAAIKNALPPKTKTQMRSLLGLASFYRRYVRNFAAITSPLTDTLKNSMPNKITWGEEQQKAFEDIKQVLMSAPVLSLPDFSLPFVVATDASDTGLGAILYNEGDGEKLPIVYLSRKLLPREQNYGVVEKECLAVIWAVQKLNEYLMGREFIIETDHAPLLFLNRTKTENGRLMRWALLLSQYRFTIRSIPGRDNHGPDFLSRS